MESNVWSIKMLRIQYILLFISDMHVANISHSILSVSQFYGFLLTLKVRFFSVGLLAAHSK